MSKLYFIRAPDQALLPIQKLMKVNASYDSETFFITFPIGKWMENKNNEVNV